MRGAEAKTAEYQIPFSDIPFVSPRPSSLITIDFGALSHPGKVRPKNEDSFIIYQIGRYWNRIETSLRENDLPTRLEENAYAMAVADGIGGAAAGEIASSMAIQVVINLVLQSPRWAIKLDDEQTREEEIEAAKNRAQNYFAKADAALLKYSTEYPSLKGMGTTLTGAFSSGDDLFIIHIGDSRAYLYRENTLSLLTEDHTLSQAMVRMGALNREEAAKHYFRHTLTSCLGGKLGEVRVDIEQHRLLDGDRVLLCTDGLTDMATEADVSKILASQNKSQAACDALVDLALSNGGKDNITVLLAGYSISDKKNKSV
jgi:PPM family protein phosphatase